MNEQQTLKDKWIVITRPKHQASNITKMLQKVGGCTFNFPLIEIKSNTEPKVIRQQLNQLDHYDLLIFISTNAVEHSLSHINLNKLATTKIATTGKKTAKALIENGIHVDFSPDAFFNSEALLADIQFQQFAKQKNIAIIRGHGGREHLRDTLIKQNNTVDYIDVYTRECPQEDLGPLNALWKKGQLIIVLLTSGSSISSFFRLAETQDFTWINELTLLIGSQRMQDKIPKQFQGRIIVAEDPSDETLYKKLMTEYG